MYDLNKFLIDFVVSFHEKYPIYVLYPKNTFLICAALRNACIIDCPKIQIDICSDFFYFVCQCMAISLLQGYMY